MGREEVVQLECRKLPGIPISFLVYLKTVNGKLIESSTNRNNHSIGVATFNNQIKWC